LPSAAGAANAPLPPAAAAGVRPNKLLTPAAALPASEVKKNLRRDHNSIKASAKNSGGQYTVRNPSLSVRKSEVGSLRAEA
jgi:hypothetical protein